MTEKREPPAKPRKRRPDDPPEEGTFEGLLYKINNITDNIMVSAYPEKFQPPLSQIKKEEPVILAEIKSLDESFD